MPIPGGPSARTTRPLPAAAASNASVSRSSSSARSSSPAVASEALQPTSTTGTGSGRPLSSISPSAASLAFERPEAIRPTISVARICPPWARSHSRAPSTTGEPKQSPSSTSTSPAATPMRILSATPWRLAARSTSCCIATAVSIAADELPNTAMTPSPRFFTSRPPARSTHPWSRAK